VTPDALTYDERGLIPAIVQEAETGEVLMVAWMDRAAVARTLESGLTHFWSRSRQAPWRKGETSGHSQHVQGVYADCDADTLLVQVHQEGVACHTGNRTCFFTALTGDGAAGNMLARIERIVASRKAAAPAGSYVAGGEGDRRVLEEVADLWFHTMVLLGERSIPLRDVLEELARRHAAAGVPRDGVSPPRPDGPTAGA